MPEGPGEFSDAQLGRGQREFFERLAQAGVNIDETIRERLARIEERVRSLEHRIGNGDEPAFVTRAEFTPVRALVYGLVGLIMTGIVVALLALVVGHGR